MLLFPPRAWIKKHCLMTILSADTDSGVYGVGLLPGAAVNGGCYQLFGGCTGVLPYIMTNHSYNILEVLQHHRCQENSAWRALKRESVAGVNFDMEAMTRSSGFSFMSPLLE